MSRFLAIVLVGMMVLASRTDVAVAEPMGYTLSPAGPNDVRNTYIPPQGGVFVLDQAKSRIWYCFPNSKDNRMFVECSAPALPSPRQVEPGVSPNRYPLLASYDLASNLSLRMGPRVYVNVPRAGDEIPGLGLGKRRGTARQAPDSLHDTGVLVRACRPMEVNAGNFARETALAAGPSEPPRRRVVGCRQIPTGRRLVGGDDISGV
jgi:hypothetical protein